MNNLGLIVRGDFSGLGNQTRRMTYLLKPQRLLYIDSTSFSKNKAQHLDWYSGFSGYTVKGFPNDRELRIFLRGLDSFTTCETAYNYNAYTIARQMHVKSSCVINYEFCDYLVKPDLPKPDLFIMPSYWKLDEMKQRFGDDKVIYLPPPIDPNEFKEAREVNFKRKGAKRFLHMVGTLASNDRNGTLDLLEALKHTKADFELVIHSQQELPREYMVDDRRLKYSMENIEKESDIYKDFDALILPRRYAGLCLTKGTRISTPNGYVNIENLETGNFIYDEKGITKITAKSNRIVNKTIKLETKIGNIESSLDHIHLIADKYERFFKLKEVLAKDITKDKWIYVPKPKVLGFKKVYIGKKPKIKALKESQWIESIEINNDIARMIGLWLAEGHRGIYKVKNRNRGNSEIHWSFGPEEEYLADDVINCLNNIGFHSTKYLTQTGGFRGIDKKKSKKCWHVRCRSLWLNSFFDILGLKHGSHNKRVPNLSNDLIPSLIGGWLDGDGHADTNGIRGYSESIEMIKDFQLMLMRLGIIASINRKGKELSISQKPFNFEVSSWTKRLKLEHIYKNNNIKHSCLYRKVAGGWLCKIKNVIESVGDKQVFAIETESHKYIANGFLTHNCLPTNEALMSGLPVIMTDTSPNNEWLPKEWLVKCKKVGQFMTRTMIDIYGSDIKYLAKKIDWLVEQDDDIKIKAFDLGYSNFSESVLLPKYQNIL